MGKFGKKDLIYTVFLLAALLTAAFFILKSAFLQEKYDSYRRQILSRSVEGSVGLLYEYGETGDGRIAPLLSARLLELPFKEEARENIILFCRHVKEGDEDQALRDSAKSYAVVLAKQLESDRALVLSGDVSSLPLYEGEYIESFWEEDRLLRTAAELLFSDSAAKYERTEGDITLTCYRTGRGYAEFYGERLVRYLYEPKTADKVGEGELLQIASVFAKKYFGVLTDGAVLEDEEGGRVYDFGGVCRVTVTQGGQVRRAIYTGDIADLKKEE